MLSVNFWEQNKVSFTVIGDYFLLGNGEFGHLDILKPTIEEHVNQLYPQTVINWSEIDDFLSANAQSYGEHEDWEKLTRELPSDLFLAIMTANVVIAQGKGVEWLASSSHSEVRALVAHHGFALSKLVDDNEASVRCEVASNGFGLDVLVKDADPEVRRMVAKQGYGLKALSKDRITSVRKEVAAQGYDPDFMVLDKSPHVRAEVARLGFFLTELEKEGNAIVSRGVADYYQEQEQDKHLNQKDY